MNIIRTILVAGAIGSVAMPALAQPMPGGQDTPYASGAIASQGKHDARQVAVHAPRGPRGPQGPAPRPGLWMAAEKLAAAEVALGITADQQAAWRAVSGAIVALVEAGGPPEGPPAGFGPDAPAQPAAPADASAGEGTRSLMDLDGVKMMSGVIEGQIRRGEAAQTLRSALQELASVLTPAQVRTADRLLAELPRPGQGLRGGPDGHGPDRDGWGERGPKQGPQGPGPDGRHPPMPGADGPVEAVPAQ